MNGFDILIDTNAIIPSLKSRNILSTGGNKFLKVGISIITRIEFLSNKNLPAKDKLLFEDFLEEIEIVNLSLDNRVLINQIISIRKKYKLKLPDAIIAATAMVNNATLLSADAGFSKIHNLKFTHIIP